MSYYLNYSGPSYPLPSTSSQDPGAGTYATYTGVRILLPLALTLTDYHPRCLGQRPLSPFDRPAFLSLH